MEHRLDQFSEIFLKQLFGQYPSWEKVCKVVLEDEQEERVEIVVPSPKDNEDTLWIYTYPDDEINEITVGFGEHHCHFSYNSDQHIIDSVMDFVKGIIEERIVVVAEKENTSITSRVVGVENLDEVINNKNVQLRSWKGTFDRG